MNRNDENITTTPVPVAKATSPPQAGEAPARRDPWWWVERRVWTEAMLTRLAPGESADRVWFRLSRNHAVKNHESTRIDRLIADKGR